MSARRDLGVRCSAELGQEREDPKALLLRLGSRRFFPWHMAVKPPLLVPFGFSVWYDRHRGRRWCWRDRRAPKSDADVTCGDGYATQTEAIMAIHDERAARKRRSAPESPE